MIALRSNPVSAEDQSAGDDYLMTLLAQRPEVVREAYRRLREQTPWGLTARMRSLLEFIRDHIEFRGYPPSFDEMRDAMGLNSKSGIHRLVCSLEERNHIERLDNRARCIRITNPDFMPQGGRT